MESFSPVPGGKGDARDEMVQIIAKEVAKANVDFKIQVYPGQSLYKAKSTMETISGWSVRYDISTNWIMQTLFILSFQ